MGSPKGWVALSGASLVASPPLLWADPEGSPVTLTSCGVTLSLGVAQARRQAHVRSLVWLILGPVLQKLNVWSWRPLAVLQVCATTSIVSLPIYEYAASAMPNFCRNCVLSLSVFNDLVFKSPLLKSIAIAGVIQTLLGLGQFSLFRYLLLLKLRRERYWWFALSILESNRY